MSSVTGRNKTTAKAAQMTAPANPALANPARRQLLTAGLAAGAGAALSGLAARPAAAAGGDPLITQVQDWNRYLGDGVDAKPYGTPSQFEAEVVRRDVPYLIR